MPEDDDAEALKQAQRDAEQGKAPSTQAGEFVREEIHHVREGKHGARSTKQAIAIGLSKARRAGIDLPAPEAGAVSEPTRRKAQRDVAKGHRRTAGRTSPRRSRAVSAALQRESRRAATPSALARQARSSARKRTAADRSAAARKAARTRRRG